MDERRDALIARTNSPAVDAAAIPAAPALKATAAVVAVVWPLAANPCGWLVPIPDVGTAASHSPRCWYTAEVRVSPAGTITSCTAGLQYGNTRQGGNGKTIGSI